MSREIGPPPRREIAGPWIRAADMRPSVHRRRAVTLKLTVQPHVVGGYADASNASRLKATSVLSDRPPDQAQRHAELRLEADSHEVLPNSES